MTNILNDTMSAAKNVMDAARENAGQAMSNAKGGAGHAVASTRSAFIDGIKAMSGLIATIRSLDGDDALGWVGLARRRNPLYSLGIFGAGLAVGAGVGLMLAPMSGAKLREMMLDQLRGPNAAKDLEKKVEGKVEDLAGKAEGTVKQAERKIEHKVEQAKEAVVHGVGAVVSAAETVADEVKMSAPRPRSTNGNNTRQPS